MAKDIMLDLETTGVAAGCPILSIGACTLDGTHEFYEKIDIKTCHAVGLKDLPSTMAWWDKQSQEAREEAFSGTKSLTEVLGSFSDWCMGIRAVYGDLFVWGNGADFDQPILIAAYNACGTPIPWKAFNSRCYRTIKNYPNFQHIKMQKFYGIKHNALHDAKNQADHLLKILRYSKTLTSSISG